MADPPLPDQAPAAADWLVGGGEMGKLIRSMDWSQTPLGPIASWPQSLRSAISILLPSRAQIVLFWGPDLLALYNDAYACVLGSKHPWALGKPASECWAEVWEEVLGSLFAGVLRTGEAFYAQDHPFFIERYGYLEETYFDISYDPVRVESGAVGGIFCIVSEMTGRVLGERRLHTLRDLGAEAAKAKSAEEACRAAMQMLSENPSDVPFALVYLIDGTKASLAACASLRAGGPASPGKVDLWAGSEACVWPLAEVFHSGRAVLVEGVEERVGSLPGGPWSESARQAFVLPIRSSIQERATGVLIAGISPRRAFDESYRSFLELVAGHIGSAVANARVYEEERKRAEALAEINRAKTAFFSNVSHEFRTPLTLMLGPLEEILAKPENQVLPENRELLTVAHRNSLRLLKLVNTLLDFSRIEAGRVQAVYEPTELSAFTAELVSNFRSACERAGLRLVVDCPPLPEPVFVDRDMWEKIVLNLLSNAFKFTFEGEIVVSLRPAGEVVELAVRDTGTGIPAEEMPHLFERFHRVQRARGRTHEGTGIGLALVQELVKIHGGAVRAQSVYGQGSTFLVSIPLGQRHLPTARIGAARMLASTALGAGPYVEEALRWLQDETGGGGQGSGISEDLAGDSSPTRFPSLTPAPQPPPPDPRPPAGAHRT